MSEQLFVEKATLDGNGLFLCSTVIKASAEDIQNFKSKPCNHDLNVDKLIYDMPGWPYDVRYCGVCGQPIGQI